MRSVTHLLNVVLVATAIGVLHATHAPVHASIQLISDLTNFNVVNGQLRAERVVTVLCPSSSWGAAFNQSLELRSPRNTTDRVAIVCGAYNTNYQGFVAGFVPPRGKLYEQQVCSRAKDGASSEDLRRARYDVFNYTREEADGISPLADEDLAHLRATRKLRIQRVEGPLRDHGVHRVPLQEQSSGVLGGAGPISGFHSWKDVMRPGTKAHSLRTNLINGIGVATANPAVGFAVNFVLDIFGFGGGGANAQLVDAIKRLGDRQSSIEYAYGQMDARLDEYQIALTNVQQSLMVYVGATETLVMGVAAQANIAQQTAQIAGEAVLALREEVTHTRDVQQRMIDTIRKSTQILASETDAIYGTLGRINELVHDGFSVTSAEFARVYDVMTNVTRQSHSALTEVYEAINANAVNTDDAIRRVVRSLGTTQSVLVDAIQDTASMRALVSLVHSQFAVISVNETDLVPLLLDYGYPPDPYALITEGTNSPMMDVEMIDVFLSPSTAPTQLRHERFVYRCNVYFLLEVSIQISGWRDVLDAIGPSQCANATGVDQVSKCMCTIEVITTSCTRASDAKRTEFITSPAVSGLHSSMCAGGVVPAPTSRLLSSVREFTNAIAATCALGSSHPSGIRIGSVLRKQTGFASFVPSTCTMDLGTVREATLSGVSLPFMVMQYLQYALQVSITYADVYRPVIDGDMPNGLTYRMTPVNRRDGRNARCTTVAFMAYDTEPSRMLPVINYKATNAGARASVWINGEEYSATTTTVASLGLGDAPPSFVSIGNPSNPFTVVDAPQHMLPLSMNPYARENTPVYAMFPTRNASAARWSQANGGQDFDAYSGSIDVSSLMRTIDSTTGRCARPNLESYALSQAGSVCEMREFGRFTPAPATNAPHDVVYSPLGAGANAAYIATFRVPIGDLVGILFSTCPVFSSTPVSPDVVRVTLSNGGQQPITIYARLSGRCVLDERVTIPAQGSHAIDVRDCPNADVTTNVTWVHVYDLNGVPCEGFPRNITVSRAEFVSTYGTTDAKWVSKVEATINSDLDQFVRQQQLQLADITFMLVSTILDLSSLNGLVIPPRNFDAFADILNRTQSIANDIENSRNAFKKAIEKNEQEYDKHLAQLNAKSAAFEAEWRKISSRYDAAVLAAEIARNQTATNLLSYQNATAALNASTLALLDAQRKLADAELAIWRAQQDFNKDVIGAFETFLTGGSGWWALFFIILFGLCGICAFFMFVRMMCGRDDGFFRL